MEMILISVVLSFSLRVSPRLVGGLFLRISPRLVGGLFLSLFLAVFVSAVQIPDLWAG